MVGLWKHIVCLAALQIFGPAIAIQSSRLALTTNGRGMSPRDRILPILEILERRESPLARMNYKQTSHTSLLGIYLQNTGRLSIHVICRPRSLLQAPLFLLIKLLWLTLALRNLVVGTHQSPLCDWILIECSCVLSLAATFCLVWLSRLAFDLPKTC